MVVPIYRLMMTATVPPEVIRESTESTRRWVEIDFYVRTGDEVEAGARVHDALREIGWAAADYILLPTEVNDVDESDAEQRDLIRKAREVGEAMVIRSIDEPLPE